MTDENFNNNSDENINNGIDDISTDDIVGASIVIFFPNDHFDSFYCYC